jgi:hypothetical protein
MITLPKLTLDYKTLSFGFLIFCGVWATINYVAIGQTKKRYAIATPSAAVLTSDVKAETDRTFILMVSNWILVGIYVSQNYVVWG